MNDIDLARFNMVEQQVRPWDVLDSRVLDLLSTVPRETFVPEDKRSLAFADTRIPLGQGQFMMPPREEGRMVQALDLQPGDLVLEVGTGTGYSTALLASLAQKVYSVDIIPEFVQSAGQILSQLAIDNVELEVGDASHGWANQAPYHAIAITGSFYKVPEQFFKCLRVGGRMFCVEGLAPAMQAKLITRTGDDSWDTEVLFETELTPLINSERPSKFVF